MRLQNVDGFLGLGGDECEVEVGFLSCEAEDDEGVFWGVCDEDGEEKVKQQLSGAVVKREVVVEFYSMGGHEETEEPHRRVVLPLLDDLTQYRDGYRDGVPTLFSSTSTSSSSISTSLQDGLDGVLARVKEMTMRPRDGKTTTNRVRVLAPSARREDGMGVALGICLFLSTLADAISSTPTPAPSSAQDEQLDEGEGGQRETEVPNPSRSLGHHHHLSQALVEDPAEDALYSPVHKAWMRMMDEREALRLAEEEDDAEDDADVDVDVVGLDEPHPMTRKIQVKKERAMKEGVRPEWRGVLSYEGLMCVWEGVQRWM
ncbi:hypothetical protein CPC08DRAFT_714485 [Agrocybe pediades]|nr:hypothetical protein CPC08DRAFT_714485 [Agrocybe pediades]